MLKGKSLSVVHIACLEVLIFSENLNRSYTELEEFKRALLVANPGFFAERVYPEIFGNSDIDSTIDTIQEQDSEIDFDLTAPDSDEARKIADLLGNQTGNIKL